MSVTPFVVSQTQVFQFQATLDGSAYNCTVTWNVDAQRWYLNVFDGTGTRVLTRAVVGSPPGKPLSLVWGYFTSTLVFWQDQQTFEVSP